MSDDSELSGLSMNKEYVAESTKKGPPTVKLKSERFAKKLFFYGKENVLGFRTEENFLRDDIKCSSLYEDVLSELVY